MISSIRLRITNRANTHTPNEVLGGIKDLILKIDKDPRSKRIRASRGARMGTHNTSKISPIAYLGTTGIVGNRSSLQSKQIQ